MLNVYFKKGKNFFYCVLKTIVSNISGIMLALPLTPEKKNQTAEAPVNEAVVDIVEAPTEKPVKNGIVEVPVNEDIPTIVELPAKVVINGLPKEKVIEDMNEVIYYLHQLEASYISSRVAVLFFMITGFSIALVPVQAFIFAYVRNRYPNKVFSYLEKHKDVTASVIIVIFGIFSTYWVIDQNYIIWMFLFFDIMLKSYLYDNTPFLSGFRMNINDNLVSQLNYINLKVQYEFPNIDYYATNFIQYLYENDYMTYDRLYFYETAYFGIFAVAVIIIFNVTWVRWLIKKNRQN